MRPRARMATYATMLLIVAFAWSNLSSSRNHPLSPGREVDPLVPGRVSGSSVSGSFPEVEVLGVVHDGEGGFAVLLADKKRSKDGVIRALIINVGAPEGTSIAMALGRSRFMRPLTHDLTMDIMGRLNGRVSGVTIHSLQHSTYFARLNLESGADTIAMDCRPSDCIALALRARAPITVNPKLLTELDPHHPRKPRRHPTLQDPEPAKQQRL